MVKIEKNHPCVITTLTTVGYITVVILVKLLRGMELDLAEILIGAVIFGVIFFTGWTYFNKRAEKRRKKK